MILGSDPKALHHTWVLGDSEKRDRFVKEHWGRMSYKAMAEKLGTTVGPVNNAVKRLKKRGLLPKAKKNGREANRDG